MNTSSEEVGSGDPFDKLGDFEVAENAKSETNEEPKTEEVSEEKTDEVVAESIQEPEKETSAQEDTEEEVKLEIPDVEPLDIKKEEPIIEEPEEVDELSDEQKDSIATVVGGFKSKSKLASGGVVIERNEPIARREKTNLCAQNPEPQETYVDDFGNDYQDSGFGQRGGVTHLSVEDNTDGILNSFRSSAGGYEDYQNYGNMNAGVYNQGYGAPQYNHGFGYPQTGFGQQPQTGFGVPNYQGVSNQNFNTGYQNPAYSQGTYEEPQEVFEEEFEDDVEESAKPAKKAAVKRTKENEPRPRNLKKKESKPVMTEEKKTTKTRGRPKKQVFDETLTIKNDKEFDEVLSRAEKLMKKSEEGLSASQSKRIEKELKMLMDAMNKYKEGV